MCFIKEHLNSLPESFSMSRYSSTTERLDYETKATALNKLNNQTSRIQNSPVSVKD